MAMFLLVASAALLFASAARVCLSADTPLPGVRQLGGGTTRQLARARWALNGNRRAVFFPNLALGNELLRLPKNGIT